MERTSRLLLGLEALPASLLLRLGAIIMVNKNSNSEIARSRMVASLQGSVGMGTNEMSQVLGTFGQLDFTMLRPILA